MAGIRLEESPISRRLLSSNVAKNQSQTREMSSGPKVLHGHQRDTGAAESVRNSCKKWILTAMILPLTRSRVGFGRAQ